MKIGLYVNDDVAIAVLNDSAAARAFAAQLPLSLVLEDYAHIERIATLPQPLPLAGSPAGTTPVKGDITYYAPWGNLAIFVTGASPYAKGSVSLGTVESGLAALTRKGPFEVRIERINE